MCNAGDPTGRSKRRRGHTRLTRVCCIELACRNRFGGQHRQVSLFARKLASIERRVARGERSPQNDSTHRRSYFAAIIRAPG